MSKWYGYIHRMNEYLFVRSMPEDESSFDRKNHFFLYFIGIVEAEDKWDAERQLVDKAAPYYKKRNRELIASANNLLSQ